MLYEINERGIYELMAPRKMPQRLSPMEIDNIQRFLQGLIEQSKFNETHKPFMALDLVGNGKINGGDWINHEILAPIRHHYNNYGVSSRMLGLILFDLLYNSLFDYEYSRQGRAQYCRCRFTTNVNAIRNILDDTLQPQNDEVQISRIDFERILNNQNNCRLIHFNDSPPSSTDLLHKELKALNVGTLQNAVLRIGYSADVEVQFEEVQHILRVINDALPNANLVWGYGIDDKLPDGHCSILLLIG